VDKRGKRDITIGCTATDFPPLRGSKPAREPGVNGKGFGFVGGFVPVALAPGLAAKPGNCESAKAVRVRVWFGCFNRQRRW
jgi:hypothetical protein